MALISDLGMRYYPTGTLWVDGFSSLTDPDALRLFTSHRIQTTKSGLFAFVAHADIIGCSFAGQGWNHDAEAAIDLPRKDPWMTEA